MKKFLTKDAAELLNITPDGLRKMANAGMIRVERVGSSQTRIYDAREVERVQKAREKKGL